MPRLTAISGKEAIGAFEKAGWQVVRRQGSHIILTKGGVPTILSIPAPSGSEARYFKKSHP